MPNALQKRQINIQTALKIVENEKIISVDNLLAKVQEATGASTEKAREYIETLERMNKIQIEKSMAFIKIEKKNVN